MNKKGLKVEKNRQILLNPFSSYKNRGGRGKNYKTFRSNQFAAPYSHMKQHENLQKQKEFKIEFFIQLM